MLLKLHKLVIGARSDTATSHRRRRVGARVASSFANITLASQLLGHIVAALDQLVIAAFDYALFEPSDIEVDILDAHAGQKLIV